MKITATEKYNPNKSYTRSIPDCGDYRNIIIEVSPLDSWRKNEDGMTHIATSSHECWTGVQWLPMVNSQDCYSFSEAVKCAREMRRQLGCG